MIKKKWFDSRSQHKYSSLLSLVQNVQNIPFALFCKLLKVIEESKNCCEYSLKKISKLNSVKFILKFSILLK